MRVVVSGGGTGGHIFPVLGTVRALRSALGDTGEIEVLWVGAAGSLEERVAADEGIRFTSVATGKVRRARNPLRMVTWANIRDMLRVPLGVVQAVRVVSSFKPDVVLTTGGYVAVPVGLATWLCRRPLIVHEQTVQLGLANRVLVRAAAKVALSSDSSLGLLPARVRSRAVVTGNPVRSELLLGSAEKAVTALGLDGFDPTLPTVYVTGGAQGARQINTLVKQILPWLLERANLVHQCGPANIEEFTTHSRDLPALLQARYLPLGFLAGELPDVLALADVMICRSGAGTLAEVTALGKPAVLIPLPGSAGNEQEHNARHLASAGAAVALGVEVTPEALREAVAPLLADSARRGEIAARARGLGRPDAAERLGELVLEVARDAS